MRMPVYKKGQTQDMTKNQDLGDLNEKSVGMYRMRRTN